MLLIAESIPATSEMVPLIGIYLTITMSLSSLNIIITVFILQSHHANDFSSEVPPRFYHFMTRRIAKLIGYAGKVIEFERRRSTVNKIDVKNKNKCHKNVQSCLSSCLCMKHFSMPNKASVVCEKKVGTDKNEKNLVQANCKAYEDANVLINATNETNKQNDIAVILQRYIKMYYYVFVSCC